MYVDKEALRKLINSINHYLGLGPEEALAAESNSMIKFLSNKPLCGVFFLDGLWERLEIKDVLDELLKESNFSTPIKRALFAIVVNRALKPGNKLAVKKWVAEEVAILGLAEIAV